LEELFVESNYPLEIHHHRDVRAGRLRGGHLEFTLKDVKQRIAADTVWQRAWVLVKERHTLVTGPKLINLFLILRYALSHESNVIEFGSYRGGSAVFMASVLRDLARKSKVYALDTYNGMPATDPVRDSHHPGDFADCDYAGLQAQATRNALDDHLQLVKGRFEDTLPGILSSGTKFALAHVDCDIYSGVKYALEAIKPAMQPGGYIIFDDPLHGSCLGAFDAVAETLIREDGLLPEQVYPHLVFRYPPLP
jgi:Macrocin-O-methyltransferase (TylF)